jgi:hypothetical protein
MPSARARLLLAPVLVVLGLAWSAVVTAGFYVLLRYKATPGAQAPVEAQWPRDSRIGASSLQRSACRSNAVCPVQL